MTRFLKTSQTGFTIIEVLIAITISAVIALILTQLLSGSLQSGNKSDLLNNIQHNGGSALNKIETDVRSAYNVTCVSRDGTVLVVAAGANYHRYWFVAAVGGATPANGYIEEETIASLDDSHSGDPACNRDVSSGGVAGDANSQQDITDRDPNNGVSITQTGVAPVFRRGSDSAGNPNDVVNINFSIASPVGASTGFASQVPTAIPFQTSVKVRCYKGDISCE